MNYLPNVACLQFFWCFGALVVNFYFLAVLFEF
jgi:hypothetical protein